ncbi:hypothetical protein ACIBL3_11000 [Kribbella sp. NPDC050124]|uniref:hypothetical protein n=1 Tax=Kribbella sp. NPDC050124 TaxID=3364114 RepID=UPI0037B2DA00
MAVQELEDLKRRFQTMKEKLDTVSDQEWQAYVKVRDILAADSDSGLGSAAHLGGLRCAMMGIFETPGEVGTLGEHDAGAVQRFANLGE